MGEGRREGVSEEGKVVDGESPTVTQGAIPALIHDQECNRLGASAIEYVYIAGLLYVVCCVLDNTSMALAAVQLIPVAIVKRKEG